MRTETWPSTVSHSGPNHPAMGVLLSQVLDQTTDGMAVSDSNGVIVYANEPLHELFGYEAGTLIGQPFETLLPEYLRDEHRDLVREFTTSARSSCPVGRDEVDFEGRRADGSRFSIDIQLNALPGTPLVVVTVRDMTDDRKATVDIAIAKIDLANARAQNDRLRDSLDLVIQRLFALGTSVMAATAKGSETDERLTAAVDGIDEVIATVQTTRRAARP